MSMNALMQAVFAQLSADAALTALIGQDRIFDRPVTKAKPPYVLFGPAETRDLAAGGGPAYEHRFSIDAITANEGRRQAEAMGDAIVAALDDARLEPTGAFLVGLAFERSETARERRTGHIRTRLRFRAVIEPAA